MKSFRQDREEYNFISNLLKKIVRTARTSIQLIHHFAFPKQESQHFNKFVNINLTIFSNRNFISYCDICALLSDASVTTEIFMLAHLLHSMVQLNKIAVETCASYRPLISFYLPSADRREITDQLSI